MLCPDCGHENPTINRFCGMCGRMLARSEPATGEARNPESHISGPSILGLGEPSEEDRSSYLLDDEPPRHSYVRIFLLLIVLVGLAVLDYQHHYINLPNWGTFEKPAAPQPSVPAAVPPASSEQTAQSAPMVQSEQPAATAKPAPPEAATNEDQSPPPALPQRAADEDKPEPEPKPEANAAAPAKDTNAEPPNVVREKPTAARVKPREPAQPQPDDRLLMLGENYLYGRGVPKNCGQAVVYLKAAASARNPKAMGKLGAMYATGQCVPLDRPTAYRWFTLARQADPGNPWLESNRQMVWRQMTAAEQARAAR